MNNENTYPIEITDDEVILRAAFRPIHIKKNGKIKLNIFNPPKGLDELSCMRSSIMSISDCLKKAQEIATKDKEFHGFVLITNTCANDSSPLGEYATVYIKDSRFHFLGHADLIIGIKSPTEDEPLSSIEKEKFDKIRDSLYEHSVFVIQDNINGPGHSSCNKNKLLSEFADNVLDSISNI